MHRFNRLSLKTLYPALLLALLASPAAAQGITNNGILTIPEGAVVFVPDSVVNKAGATLTNAGRLVVGRNFTNAGTASLPGQLVFAGSVRQRLAASGATIGRVQVRNTGTGVQNRLVIPADVTITDSLTLTSGMVIMPAAVTVSLPDGGIVSGEATGRYVLGNLRVTRTSVSSAVDFTNGATLDGTANPLGTVVVTRAAGLLTPNGSYGVNNANGSFKSIDRVWTVTTTQPVTSAIPVTLAWLSDNDNGQSGFTSARAWRATSGTTWQPVGLTQAAATTATTRSFSFTTTVLGALTVSSSAVPLPVELTGFTAARQGETALLRWNTASEKNSAYFLVESSLDGQHYAELGQVAAHGTTTQSSAYQFTDTRLSRYAGALVYYRLRQVDLDGTVAYSPVRTLRLTPAEALVAQVFPNPSAGQVTLRVEAPQAGEAALLLRDATGRAVWQGKLLLQAGVNELPLPAAETLPKGLYLLSVQQGAAQQSVKLVRE